MGDLATANEHLEVLRKKFPGSQRVRRLEGMRCEAEGDFSAASKIYEEMLVENPANSLARKRQVCACVSIVVGVAADVVTMSSCPRAQSMIFV